MNILVVAANWPMPDRSSGDLRFFEFLKALAIQNSVRFCAYKAADSRNGVDTSAYQAVLEESGVIAVDRDPIASFKSGLADVILFEFHFAASSYLDAARFWRPAARVLIDSVDVHFNRYFAKARITRSEQDYSAAEAMRKTELAIYRRADVVITVSEEEKKILQAEVKDLPVEVIPNIHAVQPLTPRDINLRNALIFIGHFRHDPNIDGILYFCREVLPLIKQAAPDVQLSIVGSSPPEEVRQLAREDIKVLGFVPDIVPLLNASGISIAPLRYGGGLKGKIGEAMAHGLPVVTTSIGTEGFGLTPGENVLVGDAADAFAKAVVDLIKDRQLYERIRTAGWEFVKEHYSPGGVSKRMQEMLDRLERNSVKKLAPGKRLGMTLQCHLDRYVSWRFKQAK